MTDRRIFKYKYAVHDVNDLNDPEDRFDLVSECDADNSYSPEARRWDREIVAKQAGEDFQYNHDGWEVEYPIGVSIFRTDGVLLGVFEVDREYEPRFSARELNG